MEEIRIVTEEEFENMPFTLKDAIYCMRAHLPGKNEHNCEGCPFYNCYNEARYHICKQSIAFEMAASALELLLED